MENNQLYLNPELTTNTVYDDAHNYINSRYNIVFNVISHEYYIKYINTKKWHNLNDKSLLIELTKKGIKVRKNELETYLGSHYIEHINPFEEYFNKIEKWDNVDHIKKLTSYISTENNNLFEYHLKKWLARTVKCSINKNYFNKNCLVLVQEEENSGKSTFCRFLTPPELEEYKAENISYDKDGQSQLCKNFIINLDEIDKIDNRAINAYKSMFSKTTINIRLPYDKKHSIMYRTCSFLGSTNKINFLKSDTGNIRWVCFEIIGKIDFNYSMEIDINKVWSQAYHLAYNDPSFNCDFTREDQINNEKRNERHKKFTLEEDLINQLFEKSDNRDDFMTTTQITNIIKKHYQYINHIVIGKELNKIGFKRINGRENGLKGYMIKLRKK
jgi:predicted P-loop ATPase